MAVYRIYLIHHDGRLQPDESFYCTSDEEAVVRLRPPGRTDVRAELWQGGRFIGAAGTLRPGTRNFPHPAGWPPESPRPA